MENVLGDFGLYPGTFEFALMIDALIATGDQSDQGEGLRAVASSTIVGSRYNDRPVRSHYAGHMGRDSSRPLRGLPLERPWSPAFG